jgi:hypothetical protein
LKGLEAMFSLQLFEAENLALLEIFEASLNAFKQTLILLYL